MDPTRHAVPQTARLVLRPVMGKDTGPGIAGVGSLHVSHYLSVVPRPYGTEDFVQYLTIARLGFHGAVEDVEGHAGGISLDPGLGFWIMPERQGRGYVTEATRAVLAAHFSDLAAEAVSARLGWSLRQLPHD